MAQPSPRRYVIVVWGDKSTSLDRYFRCFRDAGKECEVRGTARWEGDKFVNDYEETVGGEKLKF